MRPRDTPNDVRNDTSRRNAGCRPPWSNHLKYRFKPNLVDARRYQLGLEDGWDDFLSPPGNGHAGHVKHTRLPFVHTIFGKMHVDQGDWIVTDPSGHVVLLPEELFFDQFEPAEDEPHGICLPDGTPVP